MLNEDRPPQRLFVSFSKGIINKIKLICDYNKNNIDGVSKFCDYIKGLKRYISNPVIAFDYTNRYRRFPNGAIFINDFGYNTAFITKTDERINRSYVYVFKIDVNLEEFGLKSPFITESVDSIVENVLREYLRRSNINESKDKHRKILKQKDLKNIVNECVDKCLRRISLP